MAQGPGPRPESPVVLEIVCTAQGQPRPRTQAEAGPHRFEGREVAWTLGERRLTDADQLARALRAIRPRPQKGNAEVLALPAILLQPHADTRWCDVTATMDTVLEAGFDEVHLDGVSSRSFWLVPKAVFEPIVRRGALIVPQMTYNIPDDELPDFRPSLDLYQDGRIAAGARTLVAAPGPRSGEQPADAPAADRSAFDEHLRALEAQAREHELVLAAPPDDRKVIDAQILVRADKGARWPDVRDLLRALTAAGYWKFEFGVADLDLEAQLRPPGKSGLRRK